MSGKVVGGVTYLLSNDYTKGFTGNAITEGVKAIHGDTGNLVGGVMELITADAEAPGLDNPMFEQNGHDGKSPKTAEYFMMKKLLKVGGTLGVAVMDIGGITSLAEGTNSGIVWYRINALFEQMIPPSRQAKAVVHNRTGWFSWEVAHKAVSAGSLEIKMRQVLKQKMYSTSGSGIKAAITFGTGGLLGYFVNSAASAVAPALNSWFGQDIPALAQGLHWFAFAESVVGRGAGKGPAMRILEIVWEQFALGHGSGVSFADVVKEPRGWLVFADLLA